MNASPLLDIDFRHADVLPDSRLRDRARNQVQGPDGALWTPVYCANCGKCCGGVRGQITFAFYLCDPCFEAHGVPPGVTVVSDEVFYAKMQAEMVERWGHVLTEDEMVVEMSNPNSILHKLARDAPKAE